MSNLDTKTATRGGKRAGAGRKKKDDKVKQENIKVWLSTLFKARAIQKMTNKKMTSMLDQLISKEYQRVCNEQGIKPENFPNTLKELKEYEEKGKKQA